MVISPLKVFSKSGVLDSSSSSVDTPIFLVSSNAIFGPSSVTITPPLYQKLLQLFCFPS